MPMRVVILLAGIMILDLMFHTSAAAATDNGDIIEAARRQSKCHYNARASSNFLTTS